MTSLTALAADDLHAAMVAYRDGLRSHQQVINRLNVYPVPDGDTGTNMALTLDAVVAELEGLGTGAAMTEVCKAVAHGSLMGARGNSGVILSQLLRGMADRLRSTEAASGADLAGALVIASDLAHQAVVRPVEGTILTVARAAGEGATAGAAAGDALVEVVERARAEAADALARTPQMLEVLARAGVVDAGGTGYLLLLDALLSVLDGRPLPEPPAVDSSEPAPSASAMGSATAGEGGLGDLRYEVMYLLDAPDDTIPAFKEVWAGVGDSIVVVGGDGLWNCHIHTNDIGAAVEAALDAGRPRDIRVTDLNEQVEEERWVREGAGVIVDEPTGPSPATGVVAVVTGEGIGRIFRSLGVHNQVRGGQSMNPSTAQILEAVEALGSDQVIVLPNNKNIQPVADQVDALSTKTVRVVPTGSIVEGFAALLAYDPGSGVEENQAAMAASACRVLPAEVTQAVRDSQTEAGPVRTGDWIGLSRDGVLSIAGTPSGAALSLLEHLLTPDHELVTLIEGEGATAGGTRRVTEWLHDEHPNVVAEVHHGGQPPLPLPARPRVSGEDEDIVTASSQEEADLSPRTLRELSEVPVGRLKGLSDKKAAALREWGIELVFDLLTTYPHRYIDRSRQADLADLSVGEEAVVLAAVDRVSARRTRNGRSLVELRVHDGTGTMKVVFFNQPWRAKQLTAGAEALFFGKLDDYRGTRQMTNPVVDVLVATDNDSQTRRRRTLRVIPVYPSSAKVGLNSWEVGEWAEQSIRRTRTFADPLPAPWRERLDLVGRTEAMRRIHLPESMGDWPPARRRLAFDELFRLQLALVLRRRALEQDARAIRHSVSPLDVVTSTGNKAQLTLAEGTGVDRGGKRTLVQRFLAALPFELTTAQRQALASIFAELAGPLPMHRLLQGDVGSGKTVVAVAALLAAVQGGHQGALMVPTEVLAEQHHMAVRSLLGDLTVPDPDRLGGERPVAVALLTNRTTAAERARLHAGLRSGEVDLVVGTHALLTDEVRFHSLGVVVIDEQHRFGVEQRAALRDKGRSSVMAEAAGSEAGADPDLLVMTATPIPRTAAMVLFGDLDMVELKELPPGRTPIKTAWVRTELEEIGAWQRVRDEVAAGHRAYVVCPLVDGSERVQARSATEELERLAVEVLPGLRLGLLHGQMPAAEKEASMAAFRSGEVQVLVATTVVEVGVDVPEATVMVIEDADRFGIAQLHQLRGRVGRSSLASWCYLLGEGATPESAERLAALERTSDGFELAEVDLDLRGEGTILGTRQKGRSDLKLARLRRDGDLLQAARKVAEEVTEGDPLLASHPLLADEVRLFLDPEEEAFLFKS